MRQNIAVLLGIFIDYIKQNVKRQVKPPTLRYRRGGTRRAGWAFSGSRMRAKARDSGAKRLKKADGEAARGAI